MVVVVAAAHTRAAEAAVELELEFPHMVLLLLVKTEEHTVPVPQVSEPRVDNLPLLVLAAAVLDLAHQVYIHPPDLGVEGLPDLVLRQAPGTPQPA